ncbi:MAG: putative metal-binding motif-containing protein [Polyangiales bacterium]
MWKMVLAFAWLGAVGCSGLDAAPAGGAAVSLVSAGPDGALYRLENARFRVRGPSDVDFNTADFPAESVHSFQLPPGDYQVTLRSGWTLVRSAGDEHDGPVAASLVSMNPMTIRVESNAVAGVRFVFQVEDVNVIFEPGQLDVGVDVIFPDAGVPPVSTCLVDAECDTGLFCLGTSRCDPTAAGADARGCVAGQSPCDVGEVCDEVQDACVPPLLCEAPVRTCATDAECGATGDLCADQHSCDPSSPAADARGCVTTPGCSRESCNPAVGCRQCTSDAGCSYCRGEVCDPSDPAANAAGCVVGPGPTPNDECRSRLGYCWEGTHTCRVFAEAAERCRDDGDCGGWCHGSRCEPTNINSDPRGCVAGPDYTAICATLNSGPHCIEHLRRCGNCGERTDPNTDETLPADPALSDHDGDGFASVVCGGPDCDDTDPRRFGSAQEICDFEGVDEDCDPSTVGDTDLDGDGYVSSACRNVFPAAPWLNQQGDDCDDELASVYPGAAELCNHRDDDCDGLIDEDASAPLYRDVDGDGFGDASCTFAGCWNDPGFVTNAFDCDDSNAALTPGTGTCLDATHVGLCSRGVVSSVSCASGERCRTGVDGVGRCQ